MFNFLVTLWIYIGLFKSNDSIMKYFLLSIISVMIYLTRPEGLIFNIFALIYFIYGVKYIFLTDNKKLLYLSQLPILLTVFHFLWRKNFYGEWLPNTYYAKLVNPWPESGIRYFLSFIFEYFF